MRLRPTLLLPVLSLAPVIFLAGPASGQGACAPIAAPAAVAAAYPLGQAALVVATSSVLAGQPLVVSGPGFRPDTTVSILFGPARVQIGSATTNAQGVLNTTVTIPPGAVPGLQSVAAVGLDPACNPRVLGATVSVLGTQETAPSDDDDVAGGALPRTGTASTVPAGIAGAALIAVGSLAVLAGRRKRSAN